MKVSIFFNIKRILQYLIIVMILFIGILSLYIGLIINKIPRAVFENIFLPTDEGRTEGGPIIEQRNNLEGHRPLLEQNTLIRSSDLHSYLLFSNYRASNLIWINEEKEKGHLSFLSFQENGLTIKKDISLPPLMENDCVDPYCFQKRIKFEEIPGDLWRGLIGIEDTRYLIHRGIDYRSILRAVLVDLRALKLLQGGSTITQQLVRNVFLYNKKSFTRKFKEIIYSLYLEHRFTKEEILAAYFNEVYWGVLQGIKIKGVYSASLFYFDKRPSELTSFEVAILIALLKGPGYYGPKTSFDRLKSRTELVSQHLIKLGLFSSSEKKAWSLSAWQQWHKRISQKELKRPFFPFGNINKRGEGKEPNALFNDFEKYTFSLKAFSLLRELNQKYPRVDWSIKALVKSLSCVKQCEIPFAFYSKVEKKNSKEFFGEKHQVGSIFKPIIYDIYGQLGKKLNDKVKTEAISLALSSGEWKPNEAHSQDLNEITVEQALRLSLNRPTIRIAEELGFEIVEMNLKKYFPLLKVPLKEYPSQLLGSMEFSIEETALIYENFFKDYCQEQTNSKEGVVWSLSDPNLTTVKRYLSPKLGQFKFFGKTGTSNKSKDNWFIGFDGQDLYVIWVGLENKRHTHNINESGASTAFKLFQEFIIHRGKQFNEFGCDWAREQPRESGGL